MVGADLWAATPSHEKPTSPSGGQIHSLDTSGLCRESTNSTIRPHWVCSVPFEPNQPGWKLKRERKQCSKLKQTPLQNQGYVSGRFNHANLQGFSFLRSLHSIGWKGQVTRDKALS